MLPQEHSRVVIALDLKFVKKQVGPHNSLIKPHYAFRSECDEYYGDVVSWSDMYRGLRGEIRKTPQTH